MIFITDDFFYEIEENQYVLIRKYTKPKGVFGKVGVETGETIEKVEEVGYFTTLEFMLRRLSRILVKRKYDAGEINTLREHINSLAEMRKSLRKMLQIN